MPAFRFASCRCICQGAAAPVLLGVTRDTVVQLLAHLLTSACMRDTREGDDETR